MSLRPQISLPPGTKVPDHIAIIPDGNRRWARARGLHTLMGHKKGAERAVELGRAARKLGIHTVTFWGLSTENWGNRSVQEIKYLVKLYGWILNKYIAEARRDGLKIVHIGRKDRLPEALTKRLEYAQKVTQSNKNYILNIALDYGGHDEILRAVKGIVRDGVAEDKINEKLFEKYLDTRDQPYPYVDLIIRTSGEQRTSGLLPWQMEYAEYYWEDDHFPDFTTEKLVEAVLDYSRRRRRFGGNDSLEHFNFKPEMTAKFELAWWRLAKIPVGTGFVNFAIAHLKEQYGLSKTLAKKGALLLLAAMAGNEKSKWREAKGALKKFYKLIKDEVKLAFEPEIVASLEVKMWKEIKGRETLAQAAEVEDTARHLYAEVYRISVLQAAKLAHLRVLAKIERNLAQAGYGEQHWHRAEDYLEKFYRALKDRVA